MLFRSGALTDTYFDSNNSLTTGANLALDQIVALMNKFPDTKLEIAVHTDNQGTEVNNRALSAFRAQLMVNYLTRWGIAANRLTATGQGGNRPVASNDYPTGRRLNRRIEFFIGKW